MTLYEFWLLNDRIQVDLLYKHGIYIGKRKEENKIMVLYQLYSFYVEIHYNKYRYLITQLDCFITTNSLTPYLEQVDVEEVIKVN